jgi:hypothetical protein
MLHGLCCHSSPEGTSATEAADRGVHADSAAAAIRSKQRPRNPTWLGCTRESTREREPGLGGAEAGGNASRKRCKLLNCPAFSRSSRAFHGAKRWTPKRSFRTLVRRRKAA